MEERKILHFTDMLQTLKDEFNLNDAKLAIEIGVSTGAVKRWFGGGEVRAGNYKKVKQLYDAHFKDIPPKKQVSHVEKKEVLPEIVEEFNIFDDMKKICYSQRLKDVFGIKVSSILTSFNHWTELSERKNIHFYDGEFWCETTTDKAYKTWFKHSFQDKESFVSELEKLKKAGLLVYKFIQTDLGIKCIFRVNKELLNEIYKAKKEVIKK